MAKLYYFRGARPNFGDELNPWLWPRLLPGFLDDASDELFLGIGTILNSAVPTAPRKIVFGSGYGYGDPPKLEPGKWRIHCVRGPRTAQALGLPDTLAVGDPAILLRRMPWPRPTRQYPVSYMPHWESIDRGHWPLACAQADIHFIDPTAPVEQVVAELLASELLIAEAMHGAVVADALRVPWISVQPQLRMHSAKWLDWCASVDVVYRPQLLRPSAYAESVTAHYRRLRQRLGRGLLSLAGVLRRPVAAHGPQIANDASPTDVRAGSLSLLETLIERPASAVRRAMPDSLGRRMDGPFIRAAARDLRRISRMRPSLSADGTIERVTQRLEECLDSLRKEAASGQAA